MSDGLGSETVMDHDRDAPSEKAVLALLQVIAPGSTLSAIRPLAGSYSNYTHLIEYDFAAGTHTRIVVRRYAESGGDRAGKAHREFKTLVLLQEHGVPAPNPLYLDGDGALLGSPGIVTGYVPGEQIYAPPDPSSWARALATMLTRIHSIPCDATTQRTLMDANSEAIWFLRSGVVPAYMSAYPDGARLWQAVYDLLPHIRQVSPRLVHLDYWPGNVLWAQDRITAVVDWEEAAYGDPGIDVAYCRMNMSLDGMDRAADEFLRAYEARMGQVVNLGFWEIAAAARPMIDPEGWKITGSPARERFRQFIANAKKRAG
jgi:aminoglycoside phosphotransferase (APT) family kinase protein